MSTVATSQLAETYAAQFTNLDEVAHPSFFHKPAFGALLQKAIDRQSPLTRAEVEEVFGDPGWEW